MKTIYKSIALEAALLSVTLALQAEIQSEGETVTADVQANTLDRLKVTLVSPNVSGARDLVASGNATIDGNEIAVSIENLAFGTHRLIVSARFGTQIRTLYALDISVPQVELPNETQEYEDAAIVVSTYGDGGGGGEFPTDYAKQGDDPTATLTDAQAYAQAAAEAAQSLTSLDSDINAGKTAIAQAVTAKGVPTSPTDAMLQMATNVTQIAQAPISINGGEMYAKQLYGSLTTPNYWNLYDVMAQLLSDGRLNNYGGILLAEYYKGYDSLALSGAGAGGAYVVSDVDSNGNFILYTEDATHVWDTKDDGKGNRWVAYCFNDAGHDFDITNTNTCPRSIHIGRHVGVISCLANGRISEIVVTDGNELNEFKSGGYTQNWGHTFVLRVNENTTADTILQLNGATEKLYVSIDSITDGYILNHAPSSIKLAAIFQIGSISSPKPLTRENYTQNLKFSYLALRGFADYSGNMLFEILVADTLVLEDAETINQLCGGTEGSTIGRLIMPRIKTIRAVGPGGQVNSIKYIYVGYVEGDTTPIELKLSTTVYKINDLVDIELKEGFNRSIEVDKITDVLTEANMYAHILQRLKQDEPDCGDGVTITLGQTNLDKLTSQESVDLLDELTNTYGYTFA